MKPSSRPASGGALLLLFTVFTGSAAAHGLPMNVDPRHVVHNDFLAWSLMGVLGVTLGMVTACGVGIYRQFRRPAPEVELLEEIKREARRPGPVPPMPALPKLREPWERPADWWKQEPAED